MSIMISRITQGPSQQYLPFHCSDTGEQRKEQSSCNVDFCFFGGSFYTRAPILSCMVTPTSSDVRPVIVPYPDCHGSLKERPKTCHPVEREMHNMFKRTELKIFCSLKHVIIIHNTCFPLNTADDIRQYMTVFAVLSTFSISRFKAVFLDLKGGFILPTASSALSRFVALSRASQMREKALTAYLFILPTAPSARVNARQKAWRGARCNKVQQC